MAQRVTNSDFVKCILDEMEGQSNRLKADVIVRKLGKRVRQRARDRKDVNQAAARIVREATERN